MKPCRPTTNSAQEFLMGPGPAPDPDGPGPWFAATYYGRCSGCLSPFDEGDMIRADGSGDRSWEAEECCGDG